MTAVKLVEIEGEVLAETPLAVLFHDGTVSEWVPKKSIDDYTEGKNGEMTSIFIPEWMAIAKGFV